MVIVPLINFTSEQDANTINESHIIQPIKGTYILHAPISINGNGEFDAAHGVVSGTGTIGNPYLISGWEINATTNSPQILINNTDKFFFIKNCYIHGCNFPNNTMGISLNDVRNGIINNNTISGKYYRAIYLISVNIGAFNDIVTNNTIYGNQVGIWVHTISGGPTVYNIKVNSNKVFNNTNEGIVIGTSQDNYVLNNSVMFNGAYGIMLHDTRNNRVTFNKIYSNYGGIELDTTAMVNHIYSNDFIDNGGTGGMQATAAATAASNDWNTSFSGNYWSDYQARYPFAIKVGNVWNYSYSIYGAGNNKDYYPLVNSVNGTPTAPTLYYPTNGMRHIGNLVNLSWFPSDGPRKIFYDLYFDTVNPPMNVLSKALSVTSVMTITTDGTKYYWRVRANNSYGDMNSTVWNFTENAEPFPPTIPITPLNGAKGIIYGAMNVTWNFSAPDIDGDKVTYYWYVDNKSSMNPPYVANGTTAVNVSVNFIAQPNTTYYWRVRANDSYEWSNWSNNGIPWNFTTMKQDTAPRITIFTPSGGEVWHNSTIQKIIWNATGDIQLPPNCIKLFYSTDNGIGWNLLNNSYPNNETYYWIIPNNINSTQCLVKVECTDFFSLTTNKTSNLFSITNWTAPIPIDYPPKVIVISPNGGESWRNNTVHLIKWNATDDKPLSSTCINISYSTDNGISWTIISYQLKNNGTFAWIVPDAINSTQCLVKVNCTDSALQTSNDTSNQTFTIINWTAPPPVDKPPKISLFAPKTGDVWYGGEIKSIRWNATDDKPLPSNCINVSYSFDNGANWTILDINSNNTGSLKWLVPRNDTTEAKVKVTVFDSKGQNATDTSGKFTIEKWNKSADTKPIITSTPNITATVGTEWTYNVVVNDTEVQWGDILNFSLEKAPQGIDINSSSGLITWTPTDAGNFSVTVRVTDSVGLYANQTFSIKVTGSNVTAGGGLDFGWLMIGSFLLIFLVVCILIIIETRKSKAKKPDDKGIEEQEERRKTVYDYIDQHPDDDSESIAAALKMQQKEFNTLAQALVSGGYIAVRKDGKQKRYSIKRPFEKEAVPASIVAKEEKKIEESKPQVVEPKLLVTPPPATPIVETLKDLRCPTCNAKVTEEMEKCPECGEVLKKEEKKVEIKAETPKDDQKKDIYIPTCTEFSKLKQNVPPKTFSHAERVVIHLYPSARYRNEVEVPYEFTQTGMGELLEIKQSVLTNVLKELIEVRGLVVKDLKHVKDSPRRLFAYFLTVEGEKEANWLKKKMMEEKEKKQ